MRTFGITHNSMESNHFDPSIAGGGATCIGFQEEVLHLPDQKAASLHFIIVLLPEAGNDLQSAKQMQPEH